MTEEQIQYMTTRFLGWRLPDDFRPDGGVSFARFYNAGTRYERRREKMGARP